MKLRHKFGVLALIYVLSLSANLVMSGWCIVTYFRSAFVEVQSSFVRQAEIERVRLLTSSLLARLTADTTPARLANELEDLSQACRTLQTDALPQHEAQAWQDLAEASANLDANPSRESLQQLDLKLTRLSSHITVERGATIEHASATQQRVVTILIANALCGAVLCIVGLILVRRWVLLPVMDLRDATRRISAGDFAHRMQPRSADELGQLAGEVNQMSATIVAMQAQLVEKERLAAAGEMITRVAHNIRNPLAGIRGLAEATIQSQPVGDARDCQERIVSTVDRLEKWLRDLQQSVAPMQLDPQDVDLVELIDNVTTVLQPLAERRQVRLDAHVHECVRRVRIDAFHFEQALVALLTNAVQAAPPETRVRIDAERATERAGHWRVSVCDEGAGVPDALREKIFLPYFTTKPDGNGVGLAMAAKVVKTHGGVLTCAPEPAGGSRFDAVMPGLIDLPPGE